MTFSYTEDDADLGGLISARMELDRIYTHLRGDTVEYNDIVTNTATSFTDLISANIQSVASENESAWQDALMACVCAHGVIDQWISDVRWYRERIEEIRSNFTTAVTGLDNMTEYQQKEVMYTSQATQAYSELEERADECSDMLADGPTPATLRKLNEAGHVGNVAFAITGDYEYWPYDQESGEELGEMIASGDFDGDYDALHAAMVALAARAADASQRGDELPEGELDFLEAVLAGTDDILLELPDGFRGEPSDQQKNEIAAFLGLSIVALSHESTGGGHDRLPDSVRNVAAGVQGGDGYFTGGPGRQNGGYDTWIEDAAGLMYLLDGATHPNGTPMELGSETSLKLTAAVSEVAGALPSEHNMYTTDITYTPDDEGNATMSSLLRAAAANEDANHALLTGSEEPNGRDAEEIFTDLYTFEWNDDGRAAAELTNWIADGENSHHPDEPDRSREALVGLMDIVTSESMQARLSSTGQEVEDSMTTIEKNGEEKTREFDWKDVSVGHLNPQLADGFADIFESHIDVFASLDGTESGERIEDFPNSYEDGSVSLSMDSREAFAELIAGSEEAAGRMFEFTVDYNEDSLAEYMSAFNGAPDMDAPAQAGNLWSIVDTAVTNEAETRVQNHNGQVDEENKREQFILGLVNSYNPHPQASSAVGFLGGELLKEEHLKLTDTDGDHDSLPRNTWVYERAQIHAIDGLASRGEGYEDLIDPRMTHNNDSVSLNREDWLEFSVEESAEREEEIGRSPSEDPLTDSWNNVRNREWPDDRPPEQRPDVSDTIDERGEAFDTPRTYVNEYVDEFTRYATN
ncbi:hypothetical protein [Nocardiopsis sp. YSL2]|uniref:TPR repeat region-containing protein n=1 Tax=Nocardiopsis sp. YSL2 TaxID=2939492 RepID=UPI0026F46A7D|nr:hypothetical protein [Nocardiopsis sp. YSL2]